MQIRFRIDAGGAETYCPVPVPISLSCPLQIIKHSGNKWKQEEQDGDMAYNNSGGGGMQIR
jgi:hypothetical protein